MTIEPSRRLGVYWLVFCAITALVVLFVPTTVLTQNVSPRGAYEATGTVPLIDTDVQPLSLYEEPIMPVPLPYGGDWQYPELKRICSCESNGHPDGEPSQYDANGAVLRGRVNPLDTGMCQINLKYHQSEATRLGLDLLTPEGNKAYAEHLYEQLGGSPWSWSAHCWE